MEHWPTVDNEYLQEFYRGLDGYNANLIFAFVEEQSELVSHIFLTCEGTEFNLEEKLSEVLDATYSYMALGHMYNNKIFSEAQPILKKLMMDAFSIKHNDFTAVALRLCAEVYYILTGIKAEEKYL